MRRGFRYFEAGYYARFVFIYFLEDFCSSQPDYVLMSEVGRDR
jgi:hypothetical protein